jgi:CRP-like cAMP-binding protein
LTTRRADSADNRLYVTSLLLLNFRIFGSKTPPAPINRVQRRYNPFTLRIVLHWRDQTMKNSTRFPHLRSCGLLDDFPDDDKAAFLDTCAVRVFSKDTPLLTQSEFTGGVFLVATGSIEVSFLNKDGNKSIIYHAGPNETLGLIEAIAERPCAATCLAFANSAVLFCPTPLLFAQLRSPVFIRNVAATTHDMITRDNMFKSADQFYTVEQKICLYLQYLSTQKFKFLQSQSYLANAVGCSRQTVNKELGRLRELNIVDVSKGVISVLDHAALVKRIEQLQPQN